MEPGKKSKQRSDCFFLLYTITTNVTETFTNVWHRENIEILVLKAGARSFKIGENCQKSPKIAKDSMANQVEKLGKQMHIIIFMY